MVEGGNLPREVLEEMFTQPISGLVGPIVDQLIPLLRGYLDAYLDQYQHFILPTIGDIIITADLINWNFSMIMFPTPNLENSVALLSNSNWFER